MPLITRSQSFKGTMLSQLAKNCFNAITHSTMDSALIRLCFGRLWLLIRSLQSNSLFSQTLLNIRNPIIPISQNQSRGAFQQFFYHSSIMFIGRSNVKACNHPLIANSCMDSESIKRLFLDRIISISCLSTKNLTAGYTRETTDWQRTTINDTGLLIMNDQLVTQILPQTLFEHPQICRLTSKSRPVNLFQPGKEMSIMATKVLKNLGFFRYLQIVAYHFNRQYFTIRQFCCWSSFSQSFSFCHHRQQIVNQTVTCYNEIVQVHGVPPQNFSNS